MSLKSFHHLFAFTKLLEQPLFRDKRFFILTGSYAIIIALLYLALPIAIESLIGTITHTAMIQPVVVVSLVLLFLLSLSAVLTVLQKHLVEIYYRHSFARITGDFFLKVIYANKQSFHQHNTSDLCGRYFELFNIQKSAAVLILEGLLVVFQILISVILLSFYHPYLFILNVICVSVIGLTWSLFLKRAVQYARVKAASKFNTFAWLSDLFRMNSFFKSEIHKKYALKKGLGLINDYITASRNYWRIALTQVIILMVLYLFLTMALFSVGSILVIEGQLSLGQLIAAEIIFTGILVGVARLSYYFDLFYNVICSADEMREVFVIENEEIGEIKPKVTDVQRGDVLLSLKNVYYKNSLGQKFYFDLNFEAGSSYILLFADSSCKDVLIDLMMDYAKPNRGAIEFNHINLLHYNQHALRDHIFVLDNSDIFTCTVREFLLMDTMAIQDEKMQIALEAVGLDEMIHAFPQDIDTPIIGSGYPFLEFQIILLKMARAIIAEPKILVLTDVFDKISHQLRDRILQYIVEKTSMTLIYCSSHLNRAIEYEHFIYLTNQSSLRASNATEFEQHIRDAL